MVLPDGSVLVLGGGGGSNDVWKSSDGGLKWDLLTATAWGPNGGKYFLIA